MSKVEVIYGRYRKTFTFCLILLCHTIIIFILLTFTTPSFILPHLNSTYHACKCGLSSVTLKENVVPGFIEALAVCDGDYDWTAQHGRRTTPRVLPAPAAMARKGEQGPRCQL